MLPLRLEIRNFLPYVAPEPIRFEGVHLACLTGPNGAGKSALLDAITWALWGKARARRDEELVHLGQQEMYVQLDFEQEGSIYRVVRRRSRRRSKSGALDLLLQDGDDWATLSEATMSATQRRIDSLLRLDYDLFTHSAFLQQGRADAFTIQTPAQRKQILADILGLARWEQCEKAAKAQLDTLKGQINIIADRIAQIEAEMVHEPELLAKLEAAEAEQAQAAADLQSADDALRDLAGAPDALSHGRARAAELRADIGAHSEEIAQAEADARREAERIARYADLIGARAEIEAGYEALEAARRDDKALSDKLRQLRDLDRRRDDLDRQLDAARAALDGQLSAHEATIAELERGLAGADAAEVAQVQAEIDALNELEAERAALEADKGHWGEEQAGLRSTNDHLRAEMHAIKDRIDRLEASDEATCPLCGQPLDAAARADLLAGLTEEGRVRGEAFRENRRQQDALEKSIEEAVARIAQIVPELRRLDPLNKRLGGLQAKAAQAAESADRLTQARADADALRIRIAAGDYGAEIRGALAALEDEVIALGYSEESYAAAQRNIDTYRAYEQRYSQLSAALAEQPGAQAALDAANQRRNRRIADRDRDQTALDALLADLPRLEEQAAAHQQQMGVVRDLRALDLKARERVTAVRQNLDAIIKSRAYKARLETQMAELRGEQGLYEDLRGAFGRDGIPAMIIETAIPELESAANRLLTRMTGGRMHVTISTQREKVTGGVAETLEIQIADELGTRSYETYSGGEAFRINFAVRVALSQMLARRAGAHLRTLFVDEGFGTQDAEGRDRLIEAINAVQADFDMILVITHIDELRDSFPVHIVVEKDGAGSRVMMR